MYKTARAVYIDILTELVREDAPTLYLEDFLYYFNKGISEYIKKRYELFEATQQLTDDLRFWKKTFTSNSLSIPIDDIGVIDGFVYRHLLACMIDVNLDFPDVECIDQKPNEVTRYKATRLTSSVKAGIVDNVFLEAKYFRPYFDIVDNNINILIGNTSSSAAVTNTYIEYLKQPVKVYLTEAEVASDIDTSQILEFTEDVGDEIVKGVMTLILERGQNPRVQSHNLVNQSVTDSSLRGGEKK